jgi:cold shock CspA family protein
MQGICKLWKEAQGYGFISAGNRDYFVHRSSLVDMTDLSKGDRVSFELTVNPRDGKEMAKAVRFIA